MNQGWELMVEGINEIGVAKTLKKSCVLLIKVREKRWEMLVDSNYEGQAQGWVTFSHPLLAVLSGTDKTWRLTTTGMSQVPHPWLR